MKIVVHQPVFLPYLGVVGKIAHADGLVLLDDVQYVRRGFMNRNRILTKDGEHWLTVPVRKAPQDTQVKDIEISYETDWQRQMKRTLEMAYGKAPHFEATMAALQPLWVAKPNHLMDLNVLLLERVLKFFGVSVPVWWSSDFPPVEDPTQRLLDRVERVGGTVYVAGANGKAYMELTGDERVKVQFEEYACPEYAQFNSTEFVPYLSVVDYMMNVGAVRKAL